MRLFSMLLSTCFTCALLCADQTPLPLGAADLSPDPRFESFKRSVPIMDLEAAFEAEALEQLDWDFKLEAPSDLELLKRENAQLKVRVSELERRLAAVEAKLSE
jgi:hypothetical protein